MNLKMVNLMTVKHWKTCSNRISLLCWEQVQCVGMSTPHLTTSLAAKLTDGLQTLPQLTEAVITNPRDVAQLPHLTSLRHLGISGLISKCNDWQWMKDAHDLEELKLTIGGDLDLHLSSPDAKSSTLHVHGDRTVLSIQENDVSDILADVLESLPERIYIEVSFVPDSRTVVNIGGIYMQLTFIGGDLGCVYA